MQYRSIIIALATLILFQFPAPVIAQSPSWTGLYVGSSFGLRKTDSALSVRNVDEDFSGFLQRDFPLCTFETPPCASGASFNETAFRIAPFIGFNWQIGAQWVIGVEGEWAWADLTTKRGGFKFTQGPGFAPDASFSIRSGWDTSARIRLGYLVTPDILVFATGGASWLHTEISSECGDVSCFPGGYSPQRMSFSKTWSGWTIGGGIEAMLDSNWVARFEYRYADYGSAAFTDVRPCATPAICFTATSLTVGYDVSMKTQTAMFGLSYRFGAAP